MFYEHLAQPNLILFQNELDTLSGGFNRHRINAGDMISINANTPRPIALINEWPRNQKRRRCPGMVSYTSKVCLVRLIIFSYTHTLIITGFVALSTHHNNLVPFISRAVSGGLLRVLLITVGVGCLAGSEDGHRMTVLTRVTVVGILHNNEHRLHRRPPAHTLIIASGPGLSIKDHNENQDFLPIPGIQHTPNPLA